VTKFVVVSNTILSVSAVGFSCVIFVNLCCLLFLCFSSVINTVIVVGRSAQVLLKERNACGILSLNSDFICVNLFCKTLHILLLHPDDSLYSYLVNIDPAYAVLYQLSINSWVFV